MALHNLPDALPFEDALYLVQAVTHQNKPELRQLLASGFAVAEFAAGQLLPGTVVPRQASWLTAHDKQSLAGHLTAAVNGGVVNWVTVTQLLLTLLQQWMTTHTV